MHLFDCHSKEELIEDWFKYGKALDESGGAKKYPIYWVALLKYLLLLLPPLSFSLFLVYLLIFISVKW